MKKDQRGFSVIEALLLMVIVGLLGGATWYVYKSQKSTNENLDNAKSSLDTAKAAKEKANAAKDVTADWVLYSNAEGKYTLKYPKSWVIPSNLEECNPGTLLLGANDASLGACGSGNGGQMSIQTQDGDQRANFELTNRYFPDLVTETVTVSSVAGKRQAGTFKIPAGEEAGPGPNDGDKQITYTFHTNDKTYILSYYIKPAFPDVLTDFELMVTKTLKF